MKRSLFIIIKEFLAGFSSKPWACFETTGPDATGKLGFSISWNSAFTTNLQKLGMASQTDEETVQMFFLQLRMVPESLMEDGSVNPHATPELTNDANKFVRG